jgi:SPP1 gp7 family putative phage head morphogenesis protein
MAQKKIEIRQTDSTEKAGSAGTLMFGGYLFEEHIDALQGSKWAAIIEEMRRSDEIIGGIYTAIRTAIQGGTYTFDPDNPEDPDSVAMAKELEWAFFDAPYKRWSELIDEFLTIMLFGHYVAAPITAVKQYEGKTRWIYDDFAWYSPRIIEKWGMDERERLTHIYMQTQMSDRPFNGWISVDKLMYLAIEKEGLNFAGISPFRRAYGNYLRKKHMQKIKIVGIGRAALGWPDIVYPVEWKEGSTEYEALKTYGKNITSSQQMYGLRPEGTVMNLVQIPFDPEKLQKVIQAENTDMTYVVLADFLMLGRDGGGNRMLGDSKRKNFLQSMSYVIWQLIDEINRIYVPEYMLRNHGVVKPGKGAKLNVTGVEQKGLEEWARVIKMFADGKLILPDLTLEKQLRRVIDLTPPPEQSDGSRAGDPARQQPDPAAAAAGGTPEDIKKAEGLKKAEDMKKAADEKAKAEKAAKMGSYPAFENRMRTIYEQKCDFAVIGRDIQYGIEDFNYEQKKALGKMIEDYVYELRKRTLKDGGNIFNVVNDLEAPGRALFEKLMQDLLKKAVMAGKVQIDNELQTTATMAAGEEAKLPAGVFAWVKNQAKRISDEKIADIEKRVGGSATTKASFYPVNKKLKPEQLDEVLRAAKLTGDEWLANASNLNGSSIIPIAINTGRKQAMEDSDEVIGFQYSSIIDNDTTDVCRQLDGKTRAIDDYESAKFDPPKHFNCRSILVPILKRDGIPSGNWTGFVISGDAARESQQFEEAI